MRHKRFMSLIPVVLVMLMLGMANTTFAQNCDSLVVDSANVLGDKARDVEAAVKKLKDAGADAFVRIVPSIKPAVTSEEYEQSLQNSCRNWQSGNGKRKSTLLVMIVAPQDRKGGIHLGGAWGKFIQAAETTGIQTNYMNPRFKSGDYGGGIIAGLNVLEGRIRSITNPASSGTVPASPIIIKTEPHTPMDLSGLWKVIKWLLFLGVIGILSFFGVKLYRENERRRGGQKKAQQVRQSAAGLINELPMQYELLAAMLRRLATDLGGKYSGYAQKLATANSQINSASSTYSSLGQASNTLDTPRLSIDEYDTAADQYREVLGMLQSAQRIITEMQAELESFEERLSAAAKKVEQVGTQIDEAQQGLQQVAQKGFNTLPYVTTLGHARAKLADAKKALAENKRGVADALATEIAQLLKEVLVGTQLPTKMEAVVKKVRRGQSRAEVVKHDVIGGGKKVFHRISKEFAKPSWESAAGNGSQATQCVVNAEQAYMKAAELLTPQTFDLTQAENLIEEAESQLKEAESLMNSIVSIAQNLDRAKRDANGDLNRAEADYDQAAEFEQEFDNDIDDNVKPKLEQARRLIAEGRTELGQAKPDYFKVLNLAKAAHALVDQVLEQSRSEHDSAERLRQKVAGALRDARSRVQKAQDYHSRYHRYITPSVAAELADAERYLARAENTTDVEEIINFAEQADNAGKTAYNRAKSLVDDEVNFSSGSGGPYGSNNTTVVVVNNESSGDYRRGSAPVYSQPVIATQEDDSDSSTAWGNSSDDDDSDSSTTVSSDDSDDSDSSTEW